MATPADTAPSRPWRRRYSIAIYTGDSPLALAPASGIPTPALTPECVDDLPAHAVADPFLVREEESWTLFLEVWNAKSERGELAHATSQDGLHWTYRGRVLQEPFHLSYPQVFWHSGQAWMVPESRQAGEVRLYVAEEYPTRWVHHGTLLRGPYADATVWQEEGRWWLFAHRGLDELRLFGSDRLEEGWREHPSSPLWAGNRRYSRPAGRLVRHQGRLLRFAQDAWPVYGSRVRALQIDRLTPADYEEHEVAESPVLEGAGQGWNGIGMHHLDAHELPGGGWLAAVDGASSAPV